MKIAELNHGEALTDRAGMPTIGFGKRLISAINLLIGRTGGITGDFLPLESRTVAELQAMTPAGPALGYCSNEVGGECAVYYAPTAAVWRRVDTSATISA